MNYELLIFNLYGVVLLNAGSTHVSTCANTSGEENKRR